VAAMFRQAGPTAHPHTVPQEFSSGKNSFRNGGLLIAPERDCPLAFSRPSYVIVSELVFNWRNEPM
jgi:hypothetical protein